MSYRPGWYPDPARRYAQRWYDGQRWTGHAVDAHGTVVDDPAGATAPVPPAPPPGAWAPPTPAAGVPAAGWGPAPRQGVSTAGLVGVVLAGLGFVAALLSLFSLDWFSAGPRALGFEDLRDALGAVDYEGTDLTGVTTAFVRFGWLIGLGVAGLGLVLAVIAIAGPAGAGVSGATRMLATLTGVAGAWQGFAVSDLSSSEGVANTELGAWAGVVGLVVAGIGIGLAANARR